MLSDSPIQKIEIFKLIESNKNLSLEYDDFLSFCNSHKMPLDVFCNEFAIIIAVKYLEGYFDFEFCDDQMNFLFIFMTTPPMLSMNTPEPAFSIFQSFDAGEYYHRGDDHLISPEDKYTKPLIRKILNGEK